MTRMRLFCSLALLMSSASAACGDIAPGRNVLPKPPMVAPVKIEQRKVVDRDPNVVARIVIPSSLLPDLQEPSYQSPASKGTGSIGTVIAGLALTTAAISLMFVKKTSPYRKKAFIALTGCILLVAGVLLTNFFLPPNPVTPTADSPQRLIVIEVQEHGHEVSLILPRQ